MAGKELDKNSKRKSALFISRLILLCALCLCCANAFSNELEAISRYRWVSGFTERYKVVRLDFYSYENSGAQVFKFRRTYSEDVNPKHQDNFFGLVGKKPEFGYYKINGAAKRWFQEEFPYESNSKYTVAIKEVASVTPWFVFIHDFEAIMPEYGFHFVHYDADTKSIKPDSTFHSQIEAPNGGETLYVLTNDDFVIKNFSFEPGAEMFILETEFKRRAFIPLERYLSPGDSVEVADDVLLYESPDFSSASRVPSKKSRFYTILDMGKDFVCRDSMYSIWFKVKNDSNGEIGWMWGEQLDIGTYYTVGWSTQAYQKYSKYDLLKRPFQNPFSVKAINRQAFIKNETPLLGLNYVTDSVVLTLAKDETVRVLYDSGEQYDSYGHSVGTQLFFEPLTWLYVRASDGTEGWIKSEYVDYDSWYMSRFKDVFLEENYHVPNQSGYTRPGFLK